MNFKLRMLVLVLSCFSLSAFSVQPTIYLPMEAALVPRADPEQDEMRLDVLVDDEPIDFEDLDSSDGENDNAADPFLRRRPPGEHDPRGAPPEKRHRVAAVEQTLLENAVEVGDLITVRRLVRDEGYRVNEQNAFGATPLHMAATRGNVDAVTLLLELGANPRQANEMGETPIDRAEVYGHLHCAQVMKSWRIGQ